MNAHNQALGRAGERCAEQFLIKKGYEILARNYRTPYGELDLIAKEANTIVFIEVKTRTSEAYGTGFEAIDAKKQQRILQAAQHYLFTNGLSGAPVRVDAIQILLNRKTITHLKGAI